MSYKITCQICKKTSADYPLPCGCYQRARKNIIDKKKGAVVLDCVVLEEKWGPTMWEKFQLPDQTIMYVFTCLGQSGPEQRMMEESERQFLEDCYPELVGIADADTSLDQEEEM